ncbi:inositol monophosphatase family protein [Sulfitobacter sp. JL08]|uniref:inositol monophosphatase family protein n=1 Tax=Sulfitobacter sp. JL08 TaxID=2070369 RepID=UPI0020C824FA|nr:inositol monophosphatase family protein [Sulfitobacter sp. JL08]
MSTEMPPHSDFMAFAETLADQSRSMLLNARQSAPDVALKADASFVTATDKAVETALREMILKTYPAHGILGEEFDNINLDAEFVWVIDPIDGTAPFIAGIPVYGTLIGLAWRRKPFLGVIDHPATAERWVGVSHRFAQHNGSPVRVRPCASMETALVTCSNSDFMSDAERTRFADIRKRAQYVQYGGSCYAYAVLSSGKTDLAIDGGLDPFDVYACAAVIEGAGGCVSDWNGNALTFDMVGNIVAAGDRARLDEAVSILKT